MRANGLRVASPRGDMHIHPCKATDNPAAIGQVDVVLFCVKLWDVESAGTAIKSLIGPNTAVIPLQNGIDAADRLIPILGSDAVMGGVAQISATIDQPGVIRQTGTFMKIVFGELDGRMSERGAAFQSMCQKAGFDVAVTDAIQTALWEKFVLLAANSSVVSLIRLPFGKLREDTDVMALFSASFAEVISVGRALGVKLPPDMQARMEKARAEFSTGDEAVDGRGPGARQPARIAVAWRQGGGPGQATRGADPGVLGDVRGAEAPCERGAGIRKKRETAGADEGRS